MEKIKKYMESKTIIKNVRISPKKLRFILPEIKKLKPKDALTHLFYTPKKGAKILYQAIHSAINNAKNYLKVDEDQLKFKLLSVNEGIKLKRYRPGGRGTVKPYKKRFSHIIIVLEKEEAFREVEKNDNETMKNSKKLIELKK